MHFLSQLEVRRLEVERHLELRALPEDLVQLGQDCIIRLTRGATTTEIAWNSGCQDRTYAPFLKVLRDADTLVSGWAKDVPISRTETQLRRQ